MSVSPVKSATPFSLCDPSLRKPQGFLLSPYSFLATLRVILNQIFAGFFTYKNPDFSKMHRLAQEGKIVLNNTPDTTTRLKVAFLGDIMVSQSGKPPNIAKDVQKILTNADVIVANVESPVGETEGNRRRLHSLSFSMSSSYLEEIVKGTNPNAHWVFNIANNHACDGLKKRGNDLSIIEKTIQKIQTIGPSVSIIGSPIGNAHEVLSLKTAAGEKIGLVGWTELMNWDHRHYKKPIVRGSDITQKKIEEMKKEHDFLIGFAHGHEEHSYHPKKATRKAWSKKMGPEGFDLIVGHGPHVLLPAETIKNRPLFHSIGNFCSPIGNTHTKIGSIPEITLHFSQNSVTSVDYTTHLIEQQPNSLTLLKNTPSHSRLKRLQKIFCSFFSPA